MVFALVLLWLTVASMMVKAWVEEEPISYAEHMEAVQIISGDSDGG